jgi:hypothetical protein
LHKVIKEDKEYHTVVVSYQQKRATGNVQVSEEYAANKVFLNTDTDESCYNAVVKPLIDVLCSADTVHSSAGVVLMGQSGMA